MGSFVGGLLGKTSESSSRSIEPAIAFRGTGSRGAFGGKSRISIDPGGRSFVRVPKGVAQQRGQLADDIRAVFGDVGSDIGELRSLENPFIRARVRPLEERFASARDDLSRSLSRRGVQGTLANNELFRFDTGAGREIADQTALAQANVLDSVLQRQSFQQSLLQNIRGLTQDEVSQALAELGLIVQGTQTSQAARQVTGTSSEGQDSSSGLDNIASIAGAASLFFSDRRLKHNEQRIGTLDNGIPLYLFEYIGHEGTHVGVMAQDVEKVIPEAVIDVDGIKMVDYTAIGGRSWQSV